MTNPTQPPFQPESTSASPLLAQAKWGLLAVGGVGVAIMLWAIIGGNSSQNSTQQPDYTTYSLPTPAYEKTFPTQIFTARTPPRALIYANPEGMAATTFKALTPADIKNIPKNGVISATSQELIAYRQYLAQRGYSWSPEGFLSAARKGDIGAIKAYLLAGMKPSTRNSFSSTALHAAAEANQLDSAKLLIAAGAELEATTTNLLTPLHRATAQNLPAMVQVLLTAGASTQATTLEGWTPLFYAVDNNNQSLVEALLAAGANPNVTDRFGNTPLMLATRKNYVTLSQRLLDLGANINAIDLTGATALHYAVGGGFFQLTKMLLENGAKADVRNRNGLLPMDLALANQDLALANLLLANGARRNQVLGGKDKGIKPPAGSTVKPTPKVTEVPKTQPRNPQTFQLTPQKP